MVKEFDGRPNNNPTGLKNESPQSIVTVTLGMSQKEVAEQIGLSKRQKDTAVRIANIPDETFEELIEKPKAPTFSELSENGKKAREYLSKPNPSGFGMLYPMYDPNNKKSP